MNGMSMIGKLLNFRVQGETETYRYSVLAIDRILQEARRPGSELDVSALVTAVTTQGNTPTACVNLRRPKNYDGRFYDKFGHPYYEYPHVVYAKVWRWPDVCKEELKHRPDCRFGFDLHDFFICVNPYHYDRILPIPNSIECTSTKSVVENTERKIETIAKSENIVDASPSRASTMFYSPTFDDTSNSNSPLPSPDTNSNQDLAELLNDVLSSDPDSKKESSLNALLFKMGSEGGSARDDINDYLTRDDIYDYLTREKDSSSSSTSSDYGFEIINYDMDMEELSDSITSKDEPTSCQSTEDKTVGEELVTDDAAAKPEPELISLIDITNNILIESDYSTTAEHRTSPDDLITESLNEMHISDLPKNLTNEASSDEPFENSNVPAPKKNIVFKETVNVETKDDESEQLSEIENVEMGNEYEELRKKYEKLKTAFVEMGFAAVDPVTEVRSKEILKAMNDVQEEFRDDETSSKQYAFLKTFLTSSGCTVVSATTLDSGSSTSFTDVPDCRKYLPRLVSSIRKKNKQLFRFGESSHNSFGWDPREPLPTVMIEHRPRPVAELTLEQPVAGSSHVQEESKIMDEMNQQLHHNQVLQEDIDKAQLLEELTALRNQVKFLETKLEVQRQDEDEKMMLHTNCMRDQYLKTVTKLTESNKVLSDSVAEKDSRIADILELEIPSLLDQKDREIDALNDNLLKLTGMLAKNNEEIRSLKNENCKLKISLDTDETVQSTPSRRWSPSPSESEWEEDPPTLQHAGSFRSTFSKKKSTFSKNRSYSPVKFKLNEDPPILQHDTFTSSLELFQLIENEQALTGKLAEMMVELEKMKITHDKTKADLETRLQKGANKYAKLYLKYGRKIRKQTKN